MKKYDPSDIAKLIMIAENYYLPKLEEDIETVKDNLEARTKLKNLYVDIERVIKRCSVNSEK